MTFDNYDPKPNEHWLQRDGSIVTVLEAGVPDARADGGWTYQIAIKPLVGNQQGARYSLNGLRELLKGAVPVLR